MTVEIGKIVLYGANGVCCVDDMRTEKLGNEVRTYYILKPIRNGSSTIFVPKDNPILVGQMQELLTADGIRAILRACAEEKETARITDARARAEYYKSVLSSGDRALILQALRMLYIHRAEIGMKGKQLCASDETFFSRAEDIVVDELATVLSLSREEARAYLWRALGLEK